MTTHPAVEEMASRLERDGWPSSVALAWRLRHPAELSAGDLVLLPPFICELLAASLGTLPDPMAKVAKKPKSKNKNKKGKEAESAGRFPRWGTACGV